MRSILVPFLLFTGLLFIGCGEEGLVGPVSELEGEKAAGTSLTVRVVDRASMDHNGSCEPGQESSRALVALQNVHVELYFTESDFIVQKSPEALGSTDSDGRVRFDQLATTRYFVHIESQHGEMNQVVSTPRGKHTSVTIGI